MVEMGMWMEAMGKQLLVGNHGDMEVMWESEVEVT